MNYSTYVRSRQTGRSGCSRVARSTRFALESIGARGAGKTGESIGTALSRVALLTERTLRTLKGKSHSMSYATYGELHNDVLY